MNKFTLALKSRTVWSVVALFVVSGTNGIAGIIPASYLPLVQLILAVLTTYFHLNPSQNYQP